MIQYGLSTRGGWLPRDAEKRRRGVRFEHPDLWQDPERTKKLSYKYDAVIVIFHVLPEVPDVVLAAAQEVAKKLSSFRNPKCVMAIKDAVDLYNEQTDEG